MLYRSRAASLLGWRESSRPHTLIELLSLRYFKNTKVKDGRINTWICSAGLSAAANFRPAEISYPLCNCEENDNSRKPGCSRTVLAREFRCAVDDHTLPSCPTLSQEGNTLSCQFIHTFVARHSRNQNNSPQRRREIFRANRWMLPLTVAVLQDRARRA